MCRYGMYGPYKSHYACFECRKAFKQTNSADWRNAELDYADHDFKCPDCSQPMANLGMDFRAPRKSNAKAWRRIESAYIIGHVFQTCGCNGPGFLPKDAIDYRGYLRVKKQRYVERLLAAQSDAKSDAEVRRKEVALCHAKIQLVDQEFKKIGSTDW